jgi:glycosyltransferase involved in cell wall biosynthesis
MQILFEKDKKYKNPILLIPNIIDLKEFERDSIKPYNETKITIGYAGTPTNKDGIQELFVSFSILARSNANIHLLIIGDTTTGSSVIPELLKFAKKLGIHDKTTFTGLVPFCSVPELLLSCDILALTRNNIITSIAGFPTKLGEYFACKKPVLITNVGDIGKYFINDIHVVLCEPGDIEKIAVGFDRLIRNTELSNKIALNGYQWAQENLEYRKVSKKIQNWLEADIFHNKYN